MRNEGVPGWSPANADRRATGGGALGRPDGERRDQDQHPAATPDAVPLVELAGAAWTTGHRDTGWEETTIRTCRELGGFEPDIRHRTNDSVTSLAVVAHGQAVTLLPRLVAPDTQPGVAVRAIAEGSVHRTIFAATRTAHAERPSVQALLGAVHNAAANAGWPAEEPDG